MKRYIALVGLALLLALGLVGRASAHAKLVSSTPAAGTRLTTAPATVTLVFSEEISEKDSSFSVTDSKGATVGTGKLDLNDLDHKTLIGTLKTSLGDGVYSITWKTVTSDDNGVSEGSFTFGVNVDPGIQPTPVPDDDEEAEATVAPTTASAGGAAATTTAAATTRPAATSAPASTAAAGAANPTLPTTGGETPIMALLLVAALIVAGGAFLRLRRTR